MTAFHCFFTCFVSKYKLITISLYIWLDFSCCVKASVHNSKQLKSLIQQWLVMCLVKTRLYLVSSDPCYIYLKSLECHLTVLGIDCFQGCWGFDDRFKSYEEESEFKLHNLRMHISLHSALLSPNQMTTLIKIDSLDTEYFMWITDMEARQWNHCRCKTAQLS